MARIELNIMDDRARGERIDTRWLTAKLTKVLHMLDINPAIWTILLVGDAAMKTLHHRTMNIPTTTDVLTFDLRDPPNQKSKIGGGKNQKSVDLDTVICVDEARRRARELDHPVRHELLLYAIHSLLHLRGYDDRTPALARRMHQREDEILTALGVGPVFAAREKYCGRGVRVRKWSVGAATRGNQP